MKAKFKIEDVRDTVVAYYLKTGEDIDAEGIAKEMGCSRSTVDRLIRENDAGSIPECNSFEDWRYSHEHAYGTARGKHRVYMYQPQLAKLRDMLLARGVLDDLAAEKAAKKAQEG